MSADALHIKTKKRKWERLADECKKKHRPSLEDWSKDGFATKRQADFEALQTIDEQRAKNKIDRFSADELSVNAFIEHFERQEKPCVICNVPVLEHWPALHAWNRKGLKKYKLRNFKVGEDDDGYSVKLPLKYFLKYQKYNVDDSPLYIFDTRFESDAEAKALLKDYKVPKYFPDDLFELVGERRRPPYRWFLMGPKRSGSGCHIDPLGTSAWNTVLQGRKRWVLFPPSTSRTIAKALNYRFKGEDDEPINYFVDMLPRLLKYEKPPGVIEFIQHPGETVYVPGGWWHAVLNLDDTIAVTQVKTLLVFGNRSWDVQNYCSHANFDKVWRKTRTGRKKMSVKWFNRLQEKYPHLHRRAIELNEADEFEFPPAKREKKSKKKHKSK